MAAVRQPAAAVRLYVGPSGQEAALHGLGIRAATRMAARGEPRVAHPAIPAARGGAAMGSRPESFLPADSRPVRARFLARGLPMGRLRRRRSERAVVSAQGPRRYAGAGRVQLYARGAGELSYRGSAAGPVA